MRTFLLGLLIIFGSCGRAKLMAQDTSDPANASVTGYVLSEGQPTEFTNVLLVATQDSSVVKLALSDEQGLFRFSQISGGDYFVRTSGIGLPEVSHPAFSLAPGQELTLDPYRLKSNVNELGTVEVTARKPFLEQRAGRLVVNVDQSITGQGGSVRDLLKKVPGVVVVGDNISLAGRSGLTILIDGRPTRYLDMATLLRDMPAENIKSIEVITQPGAEFEAEGAGAVINIIPKKNALLGTNGSAYLSGGYGQRAKIRSGISATHRAGDLNLSGGLYYSHREWVEGLDLVRRFPDRYFVQDNETVGVPNWYTARLGADYDLTERQRIGLNARYSYGDSPRNTTNRTQIFSTENDAPLGEFTNVSRGERRQNIFNFDAFYRIQLDTNGQELNLDASLNGFTRDGLVTLTTAGADFPDRTNDQPSTATIYSAQLDYKRPLGDRLALKAGAKVSRAALDNELLSRVARPGGGSEIDRGLSNHFLYDEDIAAGYLSLSFTQPEGIDANLGLRYEATRTTGNNLTIDSLTQRNYANFFPSLSVTAPVAGPLGVSLAYSYRLERPSYYDLNPFINYLDPLTFERGNPFLQPEYVHSTQLSLTYEKQPFLNLGYDYTSDVISDVTEQDPTSGQAFQTTVNLDRYVRYGGSFFFPLDFIAKPISGYGGIMAYYNDYSSDYLGGQFDQDQWSTTYFLQLQAKLPGAWKGEASGWYQGRGLDGIIRHDALYGVDLGLERDFLDDRLNLTLSAENIIQQFFTGRIDYQEQDISILSTWEAPVYYATLKYNFGNRFLKSREKRKSAASEERGRLSD